MTWNPNLRKAAYYLRQSGFTIERISNTIGCDIRTVNRWLYRNGGLIRMPTTTGTILDDVAPSRQRQGFIKMWTAAEASRLKILLADDLYIADAAEALGRSYRSVYDFATKHKIEFKRDLPCKTRPRRKPNLY